MVGVLNGGDVEYALTSNQLFANVPGNDSGKTLGKTRPLTNDQVKDGEKGWMYSYTLASALTKSGPLPIVTTGKS